MDTQQLEFNYCYILDNVLYDCEITPIIDTSKLQRHYYSLIFSTEYQEYYIIIDYEISPAILDNYARMKETNLPTDVLELLCNELFGYRNLDFLDVYDSGSRFNYLVRQYILDYKCKFAYVDMYYPENHIKIVSDNETTTEIYKHYSQDLQDRYKGMFAWIKEDYLP